MSCDLKILVKHRNDLLLAEAAGWLHDMGKCSDEMIEWQAVDHPANSTFQNNNDYKTHFKYLVQSAPDLTLLGEKVPFTEPIENGMPWVLNPKGKKYKGSVYASSGVPPSYLVRVLGRCHAAAHIEKEEPQDEKQKEKFDELGQQTVEDTRLSSPFGFEGGPLRDLTVRLKGLPFDYLDKVVKNCGVPGNLNKIVSIRESFRSKVESAFLNAPGDTRRPINEVTLWDWSSAVAALYKAALAGALLMGSQGPEPDKLHWRLLAVRFDSAKVLEQVAGLPALLARRKWLQDGLDRVRELLEVCYPLGTEVYRDENGSIFVVPDIADILKYQDGGKQLSDLIKEALSFDGELVVTPEIDPRGWWAQRPNRKDSSQKDELPPITEHIEKTPLITADPGEVSAWWQEPAEICLISGVRPQGPSEEGRERKISDYWLDQVKGRAREWLKNLSSTIWMDEVADANGRVCLVCGQFALGGWLNPDGYVKTLLFTAPEFAGQKNPSFARMQRIWRTTKRFWEEIKNDFNEMVGTAGGRLQIIDFSIKNNIPEGAYELNAETIRISVFYTGAGFLVIENLVRAARLLKAGEKDIKDHHSAAMFVKRSLEGKTVMLEEPSGYGSSSKELGKLEIKRVDLESLPYLPVIPIFAEPRTFMALVPAGKAFAVAKAIKGKYQREMSKVRNRLPLTMGLVFAGSHMPLAAILDAGRRMLRQPVEPEQWEISAVNPLPPRSSGPEEVKLKLNRDGQQLTLTVRTVMGDGVTEDIWYPYWQVEKDKQGSKPSGRRQFSFNGAAWVHVCDLKEGDKVSLAPARFDFEFLDAAARRFEIAYDAGQRRGSNRSSRPYYLEDLDELEALWNKLAKGLARSQIKNLEELIEVKRAEWAGENQEVFKRFVKDVLVNANWKTGQRPEGEDFDKLHRAAVTGMLADTVELFMDIFKLG